MNMMFKKFILAFSLILFFVLFPTYCDAGGPLEVRNGKPLSYGKRPLVYRFDQGNLGTLSNDEAVALVEGLFSSWSSVETATIMFKQDTLRFLDTDVNSSNFEKFLKPKSLEDLNGFTPVVFDVDGSLSDALLGEGGGNAVLGFAGPVVFSSGSFHKIVESQITLNGRFINGISDSTDLEVDLEKFKLTILHEIGHAIALDHSQINSEAIQPGAPQILKNTVPVMFPRGVSSLFEVKQDDKSALSLLYPNKSELVNFGKIEGKVFRADGIKPALGANVIARNINDPQNEAISCVSDYLIRKDGLYTFFAVPPGDYRIEIEPINPAFVQGARSGTTGPSVGPYTKNENDESFKDPVPKGFFTGINSPVTTDESKALVINVKAGQLLKDLDIVATVDVSGDANITIDGESNVQLKPTGARIKLTANSSNFLSDFKCRVFHDSEFNIGIKPNSFVLSQSNSTKSFRVIFPKSFVSVLSAGGNDKVTINVNCANGASDILQLNLSI